MKPSFTIIIPEDADADDIIETIDEKYFSCELIVDSEFVCENSLSITYRYVIRSKEEDKYYEFFLDKGVAEYNAYEGEEEVEIEVFEVEPYQETVTKYRRKL